MQPQMNQPANNSERDYRQYLWWSGRELKARWHFWEVKSDNWRLKSTTIGHQSEIYSRVYSQFKNTRGPSQ